MITINKNKHMLMDYIWFIYFNIIYSFVFIINNMQMMSTITLALCVAFIFVIRKQVTFSLNARFFKSYAFWYFLFFLFASMSYAWSSNAGRASSNIFTTLIQIVVFLFCFEWYVDSEKKIQDMIIIFCWASFIFAVIVLLTSPVSTYNTLDFGGITKQHRNTIGYILMYGVIFDCYVFKKYNKKIYIVLSLVCFLVSLLSGSRKIIIGYALAICLWIVFQSNVKKVIKLTGALLALALIIVPIAYQIPFVKETFGERLLAIFDDTIVDGSILARNRAKELAKVLFLQSPIYGKGWNAVVSNYAAYWDRANSIYAHNNFLELAADFGLIGIFLFYRPFISELFLNIKCVRKSDESRIVVICILVMLALDYGQVTYWYMFMTIVYAIFMKLSSINRGEIRQ